MYDVIIIGGGAAGLSAAMFALGKQLDFLVIATALGGKAGTPQQLGGQIEPEYLAGTEATTLFKERLTQTGDRVLADTVLEVSKSDDIFWVKTEYNGILQAATVIVATGARPIALDVPGAKQLQGYGLGYSLVTHAHLLKGRRVAVIGSSVRALRGIAEIAHSAEQVYLITPEQQALQGKLGQRISESPYVEILAGYEVKELRGEEFVEGVVVEYEGETRSIEIDAAFIDLGLVPLSSMVHELAQIDSEGFIVVDERNMTTVPGLFAAGDVTTAFGEQVLIAIGDGARAALSAYDYILSNSFTKPLDA